ncbi:MAG: hypothetical protein ACK417_02810 [Bacteroidia bacterium]
MKKLFTLVVVLFATASIAEAQIAAGKLMIGGNANFSTGGNTWDLNPTAGYFIADDLALGADLGIGDAGGGLYVNLGVAARKYWSILDNTYLYGHAGLGLGVAGGGPVRVNVYPGVMYFFNERLAIDGALNGLGGGGIGLSLLF